MTNSMIVLGKYLIDKSINKVAVSIKTEIAKSCLSFLSIRENTNLKAEKLHLITFAIDADSKEILQKMCGHLKLSK